MERHSSTTAAVLPVHQNPYHEDMASVFSLLTSKEIALTPYYVQFNELGIVLGRQE